MTDEFYDDVACTFLESAIGEYSWWRRRRYTYDIGAVSGDYRHFRAEVACEDAPTWRAFDARNVRNAFERLRAGPVMGLHEGTRARLVAAEVIGDAGDVDASDADIVGQIDFLGEVIYG